MSTIFDGRTGVVIQGITGHQGRFHTQAMLEFGTRVVAGVTPGKGGSEVMGIPVFNTMGQAVKRSGAETSVLFVPAPSAKDAIYEAIDSGVTTVVVITEHIPPLDAVDFIQYARLNGVRIIGPNSPGVASPGRTKVGIMPSAIFRPGTVGVISRSGTLTYEVVSALSESRIGQSICLGIGGDPIVGTNFVEALSLLEENEGTERIVLIGEIGGAAEEEAATYIAARMTKPVVAYIAGRSAPSGKRMGHAGAIISQGRGTAQSKIEAMTKAGVKVASIPAEIPSLLGKR